MPDRPAMAAFLGGAVVILFISCKQNYANKPCSVRRGWVPPPILGLSFTAGSPSSRPRSSPSTYWVAGSASESGEEVGVWWSERFDNLTSNDEKGLLCVFALLRLAWMLQKKKEWCDEHGHTKDERLVGSFEGISGRRDRCHHVGRWMMRRNANTNVLHLVPAVSRDMEGKKIVLD